MFIVSWKKPLLGQALIWQNLKNFIVSKNISISLSTIIFYEDYLSNSWPLMRSLNALNVHQVNLYHRLNFKHKLKNNQTPLIFSDIMKKTNHKYPSNFSKTYYSLKQYSLTSKFLISSFGTKLWNNYHCTKNEVFY